MKCFLSILLLAVPATLLSQTRSANADICVYGGTSAGVIAAYTAGMSGKSVILVEPGRHLGGMSSGGLGFTDIGNKYVVQGLALDFYRRLGKHYGKLEQWIFEPGVAEAIFNEYASGAGIEVRYESRLADVEKTGNKVNAITVESSRKPGTATRREIRAKVFIDCSYEGDLMARSGIAHTVGREDNSLYREIFNGVELLHQHQFPDGIDPYVIKGDSASGLLYGINPAPVQPNGTGDRKVQAYNFRITLTDRPENRIPVTRPDGYDSTRYELLLRLKELRPWKRHTDVFIWSRMPNGKTDINNFGGFSTDVIGENWNYPGASYEERDRIVKFHEDYTKGLLYFIGHDERIPDTIRSGMLEWGYPRDEYADNNHWSHQLYVRESRRMIGETVMTQHHCQGRETVSDGIAWAAYTMDSHNCDRHVVNGMVKNEGNVEVGGFAPYPISYGAIVPRREEACNVIVPVCLSASHIAYGSIRMEPVFMVLGQAAAIASGLAIDNYQGIVQQVPAEEIRTIFNSNPLADGSIPEILIDNSSSGVSFTGEWQTVRDSWKAYGADYLVDTSPGNGAKAVRFRPQIPHEGRYDVYLFFPRVPNGTSRTRVNVFDGATNHDITIDHSSIIVEGQTSGEWVHLGRFSIPAGDISCIEITNRGADGIVVADAALFIHREV
ncbi:MAG: FAD-dependent oxidoreductase [Tannerella sp.]|jgi:hypothetical protein|nr:FAD-dependent oxidoreductase [Tannerella sp.]